MLGISISGQKSWEQGCLMGMHDVTSVASLTPSLWRVARILPSIAG